MLTDGYRPVRSVQTREGGPRKSGTGFGGPWTGAASSNGVTDQCRSMWTGSKPAGNAIRRLVQGRTVEPDDVPPVFIVVLDFWAVGVVIVCGQLMRGEMAVRDGVLVLVSGAGVVDVRRREGRCERQERRDETGRRGASQGTRNHGWHY